MTMDHPETSRRSSLFRKYFFALFLAATIPLLVKSVSDGWFGYQDQRAMLDELLRVQASSASKRIELFIDDIRARLSWTVQQPWSAATPQEHYIDAVHVLRHAPAVWSIRFIDDLNKERLFVSRTDLDHGESTRDYSNDPTVAGARLHHIWFGSLEYIENSEPHMKIAVAGNRKETSVAIAEINLKFIRDVITRIQVGKTGYAFVVDRDQYLIAHPDLGKVLLGSHIVDSMRKFRGAFLGPPEEAIVTTDPDGRTVLATMTPALAGVEWNVFVVEPVAEAFAPIYFALWRTGGLLLAAALVTAVMAYLLARHMTGPIRLLEAGARRIGAGQFDHRIVVSTGDELEQLGNSFNRMAADLALSQERSERIARLKRFLAPQVAELVEKTGDEAVLAGQRAEIVAVFCDLRGFTAFSTHAEPEEIMQLLGEYYGALGSVISRHQATLTNFSADGLMVLVNAPVPCSEPALASAKMAIEMRSAIHQMIARWRNRGFEIGFGVGLAMGWATVGRIGYEGRVDYTAIGNVVNLAARLCSIADDQQIICDQVIADAAKASFPITGLGMRQLKGYDRQVSVYSLGAKGEEPSDGVIRLVKS
jgi:class 3 adenylate cyclase